MLTNHLPVTQKHVETSWGTLNVVYSDKTAQITLNRRVRSYQFAGFTYNSSLLCIKRTCENGCFLRTPHKLHKLGKFPVSLKN